MKLYALTLLLLVASASLVAQDAARKEPAPAKPASDARVAAQKFQQEQRTPAAQLARSPQGLLIERFTYGEGGRVYVTLRNLTSSTISVDGTKLRALDYFTRRVFSGESTSGYYVEAGRSRAVLIGFIGYTETPLALCWAGAEIWVDMRGALYSAVDDVVAVRRAAQVKADQEYRKSMLSPVKPGYQPATKGN